MSKFALPAVLLMLAVAGCASAPPRNINNACAVFDQRDGFFGNWHSAAKRAEKTHGIPMPILMATVRKESGFRSDARPPRTKLLGFIPWKRASSAYGFSQALNGTWDQYRRETGKGLARRSNFADAVDFVGWYHAKTVTKNGVAPTDAYNLYLAYYQGWGGARRGGHSAAVRRTAQETSTMAKRYQAQLAACGRS